MVRFELLDPEIRGVLGKKVSEARSARRGLSGPEKYVDQLYREIERRGLKTFRPGVLPDRRVGLSRPAARARHSVLPRRPEAAHDREAPWMRSRPSGRS